MRGCIVHARAHELDHRTKLTASTRKHTGKTAPSPGPVGLILIGLVVFGLVLFGLVLAWVLGAPGCLVFFFAFSP